MLGSLPINDVDGEERRSDHRSRKSHRDWGSHFKLADDESERRAAAQDNTTCCPLLFVPATAEWAHEGFVLQAPDVVDRQTSKLSFVVACCRFGIVQANGDFACITQHEGTLVATSRAAL
jgi:hypothetical protein